MKTSTLRRGAIALAAAASLAAPMLAQAQNAPWLVRVRAVNLDSANKDDTGLGLTINNKVIPEVDISVLLLAEPGGRVDPDVPAKHTVYSNGTEIGTLKHLPPTLTVQYHFPMGALKPYLGVGVNATNFSDVNVLGGAANVDRTSFGLALQVGVDYEISKNVYLNVDIKKVQIRTDVSASTAPTPASSRSTRCWSAWASASLLRRALQPASPKGTLRRPFFMAQLRAAATSRRPRSAGVELEVRLVGQQQRLEAVGVADPDGHRRRPDRLQRAVEEAAAVAQAHTPRPVTQARHHEHLGHELLGVLGLGDVVGVELGRAAGVPDVEAQRARSRGRRPAGRCAA